MPLLMQVDMKFSVLYIPYHHDDDTRNSLKKSENKFGDFNYLLYLCIGKRKQYENYQDSKRLEGTD